MREEVTPQQTEPRQTEPGERLERLAPGALKPNPRNARTHSKKQIARIADSISAFGFTAPVLIDENDMIIAGHGRAEAAKRLRLPAIPCRRVAHLSAAQKRGLTLADNKLALGAGWDGARLGAELKDLADIDIDFDIEATGFSLADIDRLVIGPEPEEQARPRDRADDLPAHAPARCKPGELWRLGAHRLFCGDGRDRRAASILTDGRKAQAAFTDLNAAVPDEKDPTAAGSGERARAAAQFRGALEAVAGLSDEGAMHFTFADWRRSAELLAAGEPVYGAPLDLIVWAREGAPQKTADAPYRSGYELIFAWRARGPAPETGGAPRPGKRQRGRRRANLWTYAPPASPKGARLPRSPNLKPARMIADAIEDVTRPGDIVLDLFAGAGATLMAAQMTGRRAFAAERDPALCDLIIARWEAWTGGRAERAASNVPGLS